MGRKRIDLTGQRFGRLQVVGPLEGDQWLCVCDCGEERKVLGVNLRSGRSTSCRCNQRKVAAQLQYKHGEGKRGEQSSEYRVWMGMISRCENPNEACYPRYGGRGIRICPEWRSSYVVFLRDVGRRPTPQHTLERIDNAGNYEPKNVRWATKSEQARNRRSTRLVTYKGKKMSLIEAAEQAGVPYKRLWESMGKYGLTLEEGIARSLRIDSRKVITPG